MSTDLEAVIGALVTAIARARRIADEETASIAEHYRQQPLLAGMSVPRVRLPEVTVDLPLVVDDYRPGDAGQAATPAKVNTAARNALKAVAQEQGVQLPPGLLSGFRDRFNEEAALLPPHTDVRTTYSDLADRVLVEVARRGAALRLDAEALQAARRRIREAVEASAIERPADPAKLAVTVLTSEVQQVPSDRITRLQIHLREEGMEWTTIPNEDGSATHRLVPE